MNKRTIVAVTLLLSVQQVIAADWSSEGLAEVLSSASRTEADVVRDAGRKPADVLVFMGVKPGMTGLWQVNGRSNTSDADRMRFDLEYVDNWSLGLDLKILIKTIPVVLSADGAL